jgi:type I restriction enzyme R subunit
MKPEEKARKDIDSLLALAGWTVQYRDGINLGASHGVAIREYPTNAGPVDYALFVDRKAIGVIEVKPAGTTLSGVAVQSEGYGHNFPDTVKRTQSKTVRAKSKQ